MGPFHPKFEDLPTEFAVFPLTGALLLPRGKLPLNIFEPRYLAMTLDSLAAGRMFAMIQPDPTAPDAEGGHGLYRIGCLGRLSSFSETDDGRLLITLTGLIRFTIGAELAMRNGYRRVRADFSAFTADLGEPRPAMFDRDAMLTALRTYFAHRGVEANWDAIRRMDDNTLVVTLAMACPFEPAEKQALLEAHSETDRAATLLALLQMGAAGPDTPAGPVS
ncbi:MAG TPA: LON peptidase substrate-binding domain-containing protein [Rhodopila sp.]|uniref:LON peptidase substrate-binding domain-containing protein n=1 Tax=Rhodopila sp. TaxID=2480087 RepID=UPI002BD183AA|nr:LON peptidase substrate-binding domain-containing protein [Rhodopila sp.]HVY15607.1 LON peptidase substrate-binding domain-containing protein [Rhodopila sp.]